MAGKRVLVLGGNGFIGSHILDRLSVLPDVEILCMDRSMERFRDPLPNVQYFRNEFGNRGAQEDIISLGIDTIIHLISSTIPATSNKDPVFDVQSNLIETIELLNLAVKYKVRRVVFVSSGGTIYGEQKKQPIGEDASLWPLCSYGIVKSSIEKYLYMYHKVYGLESLSLRLSNPYGPRQDPTKPLGAISVFLYRCLKGERIEVWGDGSAVRDYIFIDDVAEAVARSLRADLPHSCYNIASGQGVSLNTILQEMQNIGLTPDVEYLLSRPCDASKVVLDYRRAENDFGWHPRISLMDGIKKHCDWLKRSMEGGDL